MNKFLKTCSLLIVIAALVAPHTVWAQSALTTGQINGAANDGDGNALPGVSIEAKNAETGLTRRAITGADGLYRIDQLPPGTYDVRSALNGFKTEVQRGVRVGLGSAVNITFLMQASAIEEEIVVTAEAPVIETTNPSVAASIGDEAIGNLPLQGRDFADFAILAPGSVAGDDSLEGSRGGLNMGARAIQNSFNIDGSNNQSSFFGEERGGTRPPFTFSQAAIQEFQVIKSSYNLQFNSSGGVINAITKSGTNEFHGEVFGYYTDDGMRSDDAAGNESSTFEQTQYGFAIGGPIVQDKIHFFGSFDGQDYTTPYFASASDFPEDRVDEFNAITGLNYYNEVGQIDMTNDATVFLAKIDWQLSNNHLLSIRDNYSKTEGLNGLYSNPFPNTLRSLNSTEGNEFNSLVTNLNSVLSENSFNEFIFQFSQERRPRTPNTTLIPETEIYGYRATFGQKSYLPNKLDEDRLQFIDNFTYYSGNHTMKAGMNLEFVSYDNVFLYYSNGYYRFRSWDDFFNGTPERFRQAFSPTDGSIKFDVNYYSFYAQDEWRVKPNLTVTYGLRYDFQDNPTPKTFNPLYAPSRDVPDDGNNIAPRVGFAWDVDGTGKSVLRGGFGYFYDNTPTLTISNAMNDNGVNTATLYLTCQYDECPVYPNTLPGPGDDAGGGILSIKAMDPDFENPETWRMSLGYERELFTDFSMGVDVIYSETKNLERSQNQNLSATGDLTIDGLTMYEEGMIYSDFDEINQYVSDVDAEYSALILKARKRYSNGWMLDASYTYSKAKDNNTNERDTTAYPFDQYDIDVNWGYSNFDNRHKFVLSGSYTLPWDVLISGIVYIRSGFPYTALHDGFDSNGDGQYEEPALIPDANGNPTSERYGRNTFRQPYKRNLDLRLSKTFNFGRSMGVEILFDVFNVTDEENWYTSNTVFVEYDGGVGELDSRFGSPNRYGDPRTYQVGAKFHF